MNAIEILNAENPRFMPKVEITDTCWLWKGAKSNHGYGIIMANWKLHSAHRYIIEKLQGKIPEGLQVDHLCRVRNCVNPEHLELVTSKENTRRGLRSALNPNKGWCKKGHELTDENSYIQNRRGYEERSCKQCSSDRAKTRYQAKKGVTA